VFLSRARKKPAEAAGGGFELAGEGLGGVAESVEQRRADSNDEGSRPIAVLAGHLSDGRETVSLYNGYCARSGATVVLVDRAEEAAKEQVERAGRVVVLCGDEPDDIIASYKVVKWLGTEVGRREEVFLFVYGAAEAAEAEKTFAKVAGAVEEFVGMELGFEGYRLRGQTEICHAATVGGERRSTEERDVEREDGCRTADDGDLRGSVQQGGSITEKAALGSTSERVLQKSTEGRRRPSVLCPISVGRLPDDDEALADALQLALPGWLTSVPTALAVPVRVPGDGAGAMRILLDAEGRLYLWGVSLDGDETLLGNAIAARQWVITMRESIGGQCRQLRIDEELAVGMVLVAGANVERLRKRCGGLTDFPWVVLELLFLQQGADYSLLVH